MLHKREIDTLIAFVQKMNRLVYEHYEQHHLDVQIKSDGSPVTAVDLFVHHEFEVFLKDQYPDIPLVSEESYQNEKFLPETCWVLDPIDGTQELIHKTGEFCVCIALIVKKKLCLGLIAIPCRAEVFVGDLIHSEAFLVEGAKRKLLQVSEFDKKVLLESRFYKDATVRDVYQKMKVEQGFQTKTLGSALKFCEVACGNAAGFLRFNETYIWDSAAGISIVQAAGGHCALINQKPLEFTCVKHCGFQVSSQKELFERYLIE